MDLGTPCGSRGRRAANPVCAKGSEVAEYEYLTVAVFTRQRFRGNPLAVFPAAHGIDVTTTQALAVELNYNKNDVRPAAGRPGERPGRPI